MERWKLSIVELNSASLFNRPKNLVVLGTLVIVVSILLVLANLNRVVVFKSVWFLGGLVVLTIVVFIKRVVLIEVVLVVVVVVVEVAIVLLIEKASTAFE